MRRRFSALLVALVAVVAFAVGVTRLRRPMPPEQRRFTWVADAHQLGPVGYRDPAGAIAPDGLSIAYSEGRFLRVRPINGGPLVDLPAGEAQIRNLVWSPDGRIVIADGDRTQGGWAVYDLADRTRRGLWEDRDPLRARLDDSGAATTTAKVADLRQLAWSPAGRFIAAIVNAREGQELWTIAADGSTATARKIGKRIAFPAWTPRGEIACVATENGRSRVTIPCGGAAITTDPDLDVYGPIAFASDSDAVYVAAPDTSGNVDRTVDLWSFPIAGGRATQLTSFSRDSYAPTLARDSSVLFKVQSYRTVVAMAPADGGFARPLATFQSETPSWDPTGRLLGITYGRWRRVVDDAKYPDIAQDTGIIEVFDAHPMDHLRYIVHASSSEDQALCWSPNGKWIAFHSHKDQSDDIWLQPADSQQAEPRRISFLGRGAEVGWPRWSADGRWLLFDGASRANHRSVAFIAGIDQESGTVTAAPTELAVRGLDAEVSHAEWLSDSAHVAVLAKEGPGRQVIFTVARDGGEAHIVHRFASEHDAPGLAVSPDGRDVAFIAPASDSFFQVFRMPLAGGAPVQVTTDPSNKTQPAWSPDGQRIAFTVWSYDAQFWRMR
jgi:Tol biopolymer transport system component